MMRKSINKTTVMIVLILFLTLSVGYALFSDTITIEGTATAQGDFDIQAEYMIAVPYEIKTLMGSEYEDYVDNGYNNEMCTVEDDTITYSVGFDYPGASKWFAIKLSNVGSITSTASWQTIGDSMNVNTLETYNSKTGDIINTKEISAFQVPLFISVGDYQFLQKSDGSFAVADEDFADFLDSTGENILLRTGTGIYLIGLAQWPKEGYSEDGDYKAIQRLIIPWQQTNL